MIDNIDELEAAGIAAFDAVVSRLPGFRQREGQRAMALEVARTFASAELGETQEAPHRSIAVVQAGTGVGKSAAYISVGVAIAKARKTRLILSSSTVALQSQLMEKDLPLLAKALPESFTFALAKGRGRYVCKEKLLRRALIDTTAQDVLDLEDEPSSVVEPASREADSRVVFYRSLADALTNGWEGDRDSLPESPSPDLWSPVAAERNTCAARSCTHYATCAYYQARKRLAGVDVIVANHDLVLASVGARTLPDLDSALIVLDEAHHMPQKAIDQFASSMDLSRLRWIDKLPRALAAIAAELSIPIEPGTEQIARELKVALNDTGGLLWDNFSSRMRNKDGVLRLADVEITALLSEPLRLIGSHSGRLDDALQLLNEELRTRMKEEPGANPRAAALFSVLGGFAPRIRNIKHTAEMLLNDGEDARTTAKWCSADTAGANVSLHLHACPILPGELLMYNLWHKVRGAVLTSATLTSCGSFGYYLEEAGLAQDPAARTLAVKSPFDYAKQGSIVVAKTRAQPRNLVAYNTEVANLLAVAVGRIERGALALFTSRRHMEEAIATVPMSVRDRVLVQGSMSRTALLAEHSRRIEAGSPSVIFGMQSYGEGLDLAGPLCEELFIAKLPFSQPTDPVNEARAEYVEALGGNSFDDLVVPAAGVRMLQWTGRGIRTETDIARITCFDRRLVEKDFGRRILKGLPPYPVQVLPPPAA